MVQKELRLYHDVSVPLEVAEKNACGHSFRVGGKNARDRVGTPLRITLSVGTWSEKSRSHIGYSRAEIEELELWGEKSRLQKTRSRDGGPASDRDPEWVDRVKADLTHHSAEETTELEARTQAEEYSEQSPPPEPNILGRSFFFSSRDHTLPLEARAATAGPGKLHVGKVIGLCYEAPDPTEDSQGTFIATLEFPETDTDEGCPLEEIEAEALALFKEVLPTEGQEDNVFDSADALWPPRPQRKGPGEGSGSPRQDTELTELKARLQARDKRKGSHEKHPPHQVSGR